MLLSSTSQTTTSTELHLEYITETDFTEKRLYKNEELLKSLQFDEDGGGKKKCLVIFWKGAEQQNFQHVILDTLYNYKTLPTAELIWPTNIGFIFPAN